MILTLFNYAKSGDGSLETRLKKPFDEATKVISKYNNMISDSVNAQGKINAALKNSDTSMAKYLLGLNGATASLGGYIAATIGAKVSTVLLNVAFNALSIGLTLGLSFAIQAVVTSISNYIQKEEKARESAIKSIETYKEQVSALDEYKSEISSLRSELSKGNLTQEEAANKRTQLIKIQDDLIKKYGDEAEGINLVTGSLKEQLNTIDQLAKSEASSWISQNYSAIQKAQEYLQKQNRMGTSYQAGSVSPIDDFIKSQVASLGGYTSDITTSGGGYTAKIGTQIDFDGTYTEVMDFYDKLSSGIRKYSDDMGLSSNEMIKSLLSNISDAINKIKNDPKYQESLTIADEAVLRTAESAYSSYYKKLLEAREKYNEAVASGDEKIIESTYKALEKSKSSAIDAVKNDTSYSKELTDLFSQVADVQSNSFNNLSDNLKTTTVEIIDYTEVSNKAKETLKDFAKSTDKLSEAFKEQSESGYLTAQTINDIIEAGYASALMYDQETNSVKLNAEAYRELTKAKIEAELASLKTAEASLSTLVSSQNTASNYMAMSGSDISKLFPDLAVNEEQLSILRAQIAAYEDITKNFDAITSGTYGDKTKTSKEDPYKDMVESKIDDLKYLHDMGKIAESNYLEELDALNQKYYKGIEKYKEESRRLDVEVYKGRIQLADEALKAEEDAKKKAKEAAEEAKRQAEEVLKIQQDAIQRRIDYAKELYEVHQDENKYVADLQKLLGYINISEEQRLALTKEIADVRKNEYKDTLNDLEHEIFLNEFNNGAIDERIDKYKEMQNVVHNEAMKLRDAGYSETSNEIQELQRLWASYANNISDLMQEKNDAITDNLKKSLESQADLLQTNIDSLKEEQSALEAAASYAISVIDKEIQKLEDKKSLLQEANDEQNRAIELTKLQQALENAQNNKNTRIYSASKGFFWSANPNAVQTAQAALDDYNRQEKLRLEQKLLDDQIASWQEYKQSWQDVAENYQKENDALLAAQILGADIESQILAQRTSVIEEYGRKYVETIEAIKQAEIELATLQQQINSFSNPTSTQFTVIGSDGKPTTYDTVQGSSISSLSTVGSNVISNIVNSIKGMIKQPDSNSFISNNKSSNAINNYFDKIVLPNVTNYEQFIDRFAKEITLFSNTM